MAPNRNRWHVRQLTKHHLLHTEGPICPLCEFRTATDLHEGVTRQKVRGNSKAQDAVFAEPMLCGFVCRQCNMRDSSGKELIRYKVKRYGAIYVRAALERVNLAGELTVPLSLAEYLT